VPDGNAAEKTFALKDEEFFQASLLDLHFSF